MAVEALSIKFRKHNIDIPYMLVLLSNKANVIRRHTVKDSNKMDELAMLMLLCVDDGAIPFNSRSDAEKGTPTCIDVMAKFSLIAYTGSKVKKSKTKAVFFPSAKTINSWNNNNSSFLPVTDKTNAHASKDKN